MTVSITRAMTWWHPVVIAAAICLNACSHGRFATREEAQQAAAQWERQGDIHRITRDVERTVTRPKTTEQIDFDREANEISYWECLGERDDTITLPERRRQCEDAMGTVDDTVSETITINETIALPLRRCLDDGLKREIICQDARIREGAEPISREQLSYDHNRRAFSYR